MLRCLARLWPLPMLFACTRHCVLAYVAGFGYIRSISLLLLFHECEAALSCVAVSTLFAACGHSPFCIGRAVVFRLSC